MALNNYWDFAENDYEYLMKSYENGIVANAMAALAQGVCEKYMKHIISECYIPASAEQDMAYGQIMRTHSLNKLMKFLQANLNFCFSDEAKTEMRSIDGFYFSSRYPGEDSIEVDADDIEHCISAIRQCREAVYHYLITQKKI